MLENEHVLCVDCFGFCTCLANSDARYQRSYTTLLLSSFLPLICAHTIHSPFLVEIFCKTIFRKLKHLSAHLTQAWSYLPASPGVYDTHVESSSWQRQRRRLVTARSHVADTSKRGHDANKLILISQRGRNLFPHTKRRQRSRERKHW